MLAPTTGLLAPQDVQTRFAQEIANFGQVQGFTPQEQQVFSQLAGRALTQAGPGIALRANAPLLNFTRQNRTYWDRANVDEKFKRAETELRKKEIAARRKGNVDAGKKELEEQRAIARAKHAASLGEEQLRWEEEGKDFTSAVVMSGTMGGSDTEQRAAFFKKKGFNDEQINLRLRGELAQMDAREAELMAMAEMSDIDREAADLGLQQFLAERGINDDEWFAMRQDAETDAQMEGNMAALETLYRAYMEAGDLGKMLQSQARATSQASRASQARGRKLPGSAYGQQQGSWLEGRALQRRMQDIRKAKRITPQMGAMGQIAGYNVGGRIYNDAQTQELIVRELARRKNAKRRKRGMPT